jgi:hypothetical protein
MTHSTTWIPIPSRPLTREEQSWVNEILSASKDWADVSIGELFASGRCPCGLCRAVQFEQPAKPQNPRGTKHGQIGDIDIHTSAGDVINISLYAKNGSLTDLDVLCEFGFKPVPESWNEIAHYVKAK